MAADVEPVLQFIQPGWVGVEIGVSRGHSALRLLEHGVRFLYLVDPWKSYGGYLESPEGRDDYWEAIYKEAMTKLAPHGGKHGHLRMTSAEAIRHIPDSLDFVWVDGNHVYEFVLDDLKTYWPKIKAGGVLCGHDYTNAPPTCEVKKAVDEFASVHGVQVITRPDKDSCWTIRKP
jgi:hypothetical protein